MRDLFPTSPARPRVRVPGNAALQPLCPNTPTGGDRWTTLWDATGSDYASQQVEVFPGEGGGFAFTYCAFSRVVVSRLN